MAGVNWKRVLIGGMLAGLVINLGYAIGETLTLGEMQGMVDRLGLHAPGESTMIIFAILGVLMGIVTVWLYAASRPRYGPGLPTALRAGVVVWVLGCLIPNVSVLAFGILTVRHFWMASILDLVIVPAAAVVGARVYREAETVDSFSPEKGLVTR